MNIATPTAASSSHSSGKPVSRWERVGRQNAELRAQRRERSLSWWTCKLQCGFCSLACVVGVVSFAVLCLALLDTQSRAWVKACCSWSPGTLQIHVPTDPSSKTFYTINMPGNNASFLGPRLLLTLYPGASAETLEKAVAGLVTLEPTEAHGAFAALSVAAPCPDIADGNRAVSGWTTCWAHGASGQSTDIMPTRIQLDKPVTDLVSLFERTVAFMFCGSLLSVAPFVYTVCLLLCCVPRKTYYETQAR
eukprot:TRINITY_DN3382_c1_g1_i1.p1 TRINITY_DN3382_c1_g1~~TRINITY_DN3382_c1_g1_i1.p1  ORF type:complete len:249 (+),score=8.06 TRINITY_DN3382_c1_g1_i1:163-909(+)